MWRQILAWLKQFLWDNRNEPLLVVIAMAFVAIIVWRTAIGLPLNCGSNILPPSPCSPPVVEPFPVGSILPMYSMPEHTPTGWVYCGVQETPQLGGRFLLGTTDIQEAGHLEGDSIHSHQLQATTGGESFGELRYDPPDYADNIRDGNFGRRNWYHEHEVTGSTDSTQHLPLSVKVLFLCRVSRGG